MELTPVVGGIPNSFELSSGFQSTRYILVSTNSRIQIKLHGANYTLYVSGKLPTFPFPKPTLNTYFSLKAKCWLRGGVGGNIPRNVYNDPIITPIFILYYRRSMSYSLCTGFVPYRGEDSKRRKSNFAERQLFRSHYRRQRAMSLSRTLIPTYCEYSRGI